jgi:membrane protease YdiL (CAAX protease family)
MRRAAVAAFLATLLWPGLALAGLALGGAAYAMRRLGPGAPAAFVAGLGLALLYARTRSLPAAARAHAGLDLASLLAARLD